MQLVIFLAGGIVDECYLHDDGTPGLSYVVLDSDVDTDADGVATLPDLGAEAEELSGAEVHVGATFPAIAGKLARRLCATAFSLSAEMYCDSDSDDDDESDD